MAGMAQDPTVNEKFEPTEIASIDKGSAQHGNLTFLAQAAVTEHALTPLQAMRIYWRALFWCLFMCIGALLWGYDSQVRLFAYHVMHDSRTWPGGITSKCLGRRWVVERVSVPHRLWVCHERR